MATDVLVPTLGESITEATLGQWIKKPGEPVKADEPIASLETDKVAVEVPSPVAGTMGDYLVKEGDTVAVGALIARIVEGAAAPAPQNGAAPAETPPSQSPLAHIVNPGGPGETRRCTTTRRADAEARATTAARHGPDPLARRPPRGAGARARSVQDQGHRQGRPPDQGRRPRRRQAQAVPARRRRPPQRKPSAPGSGRRPQPLPPHPASAARSASA
jgi:2-oxoglutarate dehydrogenase E2 component (dihydrolipoamide succinyltransferase)